MELTDLRNRIIGSFQGSSDDLQEILAMVDEDQAIFPFNENSQDSRIYTQTVTYESPTQNRRELDNGIQ